MDDDFNTADAVSAIFELVKLCQQHSVDEKSTRAYVQDCSRTIWQNCAMFLVLIAESKTERCWTSEIEELIAATSGRRERTRDFARADEIRDETSGIWAFVLEDTREGVKWKTSVDTLAEVIRRQFGAGNSRISRTCSPLNYWPILEIRSL